MKTIILFLATSLVALWFAGQVLYPASHTVTHGFGAYYTAARLVQSGQFSEQVYEPVYFRPLVKADSGQQADDIYNANPPTTALLLWPLSFFSIQTARLLWTLANAAMLFAGLALLVKTFASSPRLPTFLVLAAFGMGFQPVRDNLAWGQAYLLIFLLYTLALAAWAKADNAAPKTRAAPFSEALGSLALSFALMLKTAGWALLPILISQRHWRRLGWIAGFGGSIFLATLPLFSLSTWRTYGQLLLETSSHPSTCALAFQTTRSLLCQLFVFEPPWSRWPVANLPWLATALFAGLALITLILNLQLSYQRQMLALLAAIAWGVVFAPLGEAYHHTVMLVPLSWLIIHQSTLNPVSRGILFGAICLYLVPALPNPGGWGLLAYPRLYGAWLTMLVLYGQLSQTGQLANLIKQKRFPLPFRGRS